MAQVQKREEAIEVGIEVTEEQRKPKNLIIVTGYGPFKGFEDINPSWEAVRLLPDVLDFKGTQYTVEKWHVPVEYEAVDKTVDEIWQLQPTFVLHCGVHSTAPCILLEKMAYNNKFNSPDHAKKHLPSGTAVLVNCRGNDVICTGLNVEKMVERIGYFCDCSTPSSSQKNTAGHTTSVESKSVMGATRASTDVGSFLCGYIYLKSLDRNRFRTLFVHVPPIDKPFSTAKTATVLQQVLEECVRQVVEDIPKICKLRN